MNNEWNSEVVTEVSDVDITVDQSYNASSENPQSGTAVAGAIEGVNQLPASTAADATKVLMVDSSGVPVWAGLPGEEWINYSATVSGNYVYFDLSDEVLAPGNYLVSLVITPQSYVSNQKRIRFGYYESNDNNNRSVVTQNLVDIPWDSDGPFNVAYQVFAMVNIPYYESVRQTGFAVALVNNSATPQSLTNITAASFRFKRISIR